MEDIYKQCFNTQCKRHRIIIETNMKRCSECNSKLKSISHKHYNTPVTAFVEPNPNYDKMNATTGPSAQRYLPAAYLPKEDNSSATFESDCDIKGCPVAPKPKVIVPFNLFNTWVYLCHKFNVEWIAYLKGTISDDNMTYTLLADGMYFPLQKANGVHVTAERTTDEEGTIAAVHSHVNFGVNWSKEDEDHWSRSVEFVVNRMSEINCVVRTKLECGRFQRTKIIPTILDDPSQMHVVDDLTSKLVIDSHNFNTNTGKPTNGELVFINGSLFDPKWHKIKFSDHKGQRYKLIQTKSDGTTIEVQDTNGDIIWQHSPTLATIGKTLEKEDLRATFDTQST